MIRFIVIAVVAVIVIVGIGWLFDLDWGGGIGEPTQPTTTQPTTTPENGMSAEPAYTNADANFIRLTSPQPDATVPGTFTVSGEARGNWYFEASFPMEVRNAAGEVLVQLPVQAQGEWMTTEFVPFTVSVTVPNYTGPATLILRRDNPSGLPENDASVSIPITIQ